MVANLKVRVPSEGDLTNPKHKRAVPEEFSEVTVLVADLVGFTDFCSNKSPVEVVYSLNRLFSKFDALVAKHTGVEKIKTVGDAYICECPFINAC